MEQKTDKKLNFLIFLFIVSIIAMIIMMCHIFSLNNKLLLKETEVNALKNTLDMVQDHYQFQRYLESLNEDTENVNDTEENTTVEE